MPNSPELVRFPVIALDYNDKAKAIKYEMIINYSTGDIYINLPNGTLLDITASIKEQIANMQGDNLPVTIEGIGVVTLSTILLSMIQKIDNQIDVLDEGQDNINYLPIPGTLDKASLSQTSDSIIQIKGFNDAGSLTIPRKNSAGTNVEWVSLEQMIQDNNEDPNSYDPTDGQSGKVDTIEATNGKLYLRLDKKQKTINPRQEVINVIIETIVDEYGYIDWLLKVGTNVPILRFDSNVIFEYNNDTQPVDANAYYLYKFETFDSGTTWLAKYTQFNKTKV